MIKNINLFVIFLMSRENVVNILQTELFHPLIVYSERQQPTLLCILQGPDFLDDDGDLFLDDG